MAHYVFLNNDQTTGTLREELMTLHSEKSTLENALLDENNNPGEPTEEQATAIELKQTEIDDKQQEIDNALCVVTGVITGVEETYTEYARTDFAPSAFDKIIDNTIYWEGYYGGKLCKRTSYNTQGGVHQNGETPFRKNYAGVGYTYDPVKDAFYSPQPYESWTLNEESCLWEAPVAYPDDGNSYLWDEETQNWIEN